MEYTTYPVPERVTLQRNAWAKSDAARDKGLTEPDEIEKYRDISYGPYDKWNLLDVYVPKDKECNASLKAGKKPGDGGELPFPVIVNIHGGGYFYGDKELYRFYSMRMARFGFAVVNINYRLAPEFRFPSPIEDVMAVMHWIAANAEKYCLDKDNLFMIGDSAGAQITSQFACVFTNPDYSALFGLRAPEDVTLRAVSLACGMYRLPERAPNVEKDLMMMDYLGNKEMIKDPRVELHSNITDGYPPAYVFSCVNDFLVSECEPMAEYLRSRGIETESRIYGTKKQKEIGHVFHCNLRLNEGEKANRDQAEFFIKHIC